MREVLVVDDINEVNSNYGKLSAYDSVQSLSAHSAAHSLSAALVDTSSDLIIFI